MRTETDLEFNSNFLDVSEPGNQGSDVSDSQLEVRLKGGWISLLKSLVCVMNIA